ncbi:LuxR C-terminal-related transcriptional regulator [Fusibacter bizertensis]
MSILQKWLVRLSLGFFMGWVMSFPYNGPLLYAAADYMQFDGGVSNLISVGFLVIGILISALVIKNWAIAKQVMIMSTVFSIIGASVFMMLPSNFAFIALMFLALISGFFISAWGFFYFYNTPKDERGKAIADLLIIGNIILIIIGALSGLISPWVGMFFCILALLICLVMCLKMTIVDTKAIKDVKASDNRQSTFQLPFALFLGFIFLISLTSGIMFQVVNPYFSYLGFLSGFYTNVPYIVGLFILRMMPKSMNKNFTLYLGMSILGIAYMFFAFLPVGLVKFFFVITPMMVAYSIFDYFWGRLMGDLCLYGKTPSYVVGLSLGFNVLGVFCGATMSHIVTKSFDIQPSEMSFIALGFSFVIVGFLPIMNVQMSKLLYNHIFFIQYTELPKLEKNFILEEQHAPNQLTPRERELVDLVLGGMTFKAIADTLFISENTVKTHTKNIYKKLNINSKYELIKYYSKNY